MAYSRLENIIASRNPSLAATLNKKRTQNKPTRKSISSYRSGKSSSSSKRSSSSSTSSSPAPAPYVPPVAPPPVPLPKNVDPSSKLGQILMKNVKERKNTVDLTKNITKQDTVMTQQQYFQEISDTKKAIGQQKSDYFTMQESIIPTGMYRTDRGIQPGFLLSAKMKNEYLPQLEEAEQQSHLAWSQARDLPQDTKITKTDKGYTFDFRDTSLNWSKDEFKKIDKAYKVNPVLGGVAEFGFGATSSFGALIKPALDISIGNEKSRGSHFVSPLDVVFEPIGWSPKGSTDILKNRPIFTAGGIGAEIVQSYALTQALKPISAGAKIGGKFIGKTVIKKGASFYGKFTKVFPEEKFLSGGIKGTKSIIAKGSSELPENIYKWGAKGYKKGLQLTSAGVKTTSKKIPNVSDDIIRNVTQKTKYGKGGVKRVWLSPEKYSMAEKDIAKKLGLGKVVDRTGNLDFGTYSGKARVLTEKTQYKLNWSGKRLLKKYGYTEKVWKFGDDIAKYKSPLPSKYPSIERYALEGADIPLKESDALGMVMRSKTGEILGYKKPMLYQKPLPKNWIQNYRVPFLKNVQGQASLSLQSFKTKITSKSTSGLGGTASLLNKLNTKTIPSGLYKSVFNPALDITTIGTIKSISAKTTATGSKTILQPDFMTVSTPTYDTLITPFKNIEHKPIHKSQPKTITIPETDTFSVVKPINDIASFNINASMIKQVTITKPELMKLTATGYKKTAYTPPQMHVVSSPLIPIIPWIPRGLSGRGIGSWGEDMKHKKRYMFRQFKVPSIDKILKGGNIKL